MILCPSLQWLKQNISEGLDPQNTPHTSPSWATYGVDFVWIGGGGCLWSYTALDIYLQISSLLYSLYPLGNIQRLKYVFQNDFVPRHNFGIEPYITVYFLQHSQSRLPIFHCAPYLGQQCWSVLMPWLQHKDHNAWCDGRLINSHHLC